MNVAGFGIVFPGGAGVSSLRDVLMAGVPLRGQAQGKEPAAVLSVPPAAFAGKPVLAPARRADRDHLGHRVRPPWNRLQIRE